MPYEESFVGLMACEAAREGKAVWNLGVMSFSPAIYYRKIKAAAEKLGLGATEIYVFLDLSDIIDDAIVYRVANDGSVEMTTSYHWFDTGQFLLGNFATFRLLYDIWLRLPSARRRPTNRAGPLDPRSRPDAGIGPPWPGTCKREHEQYVTLSGSGSVGYLVVYPWPDNVAAGDRHSIQVTYWRRWAARRGVRFVDGLAPFFAEPPEVAERKYFIQGGAHFTPQGHRLLFEELRRSNSPF